MSVRKSFNYTLLIIVSAACFSASVIATCLPLMSSHFKVTNDQITLVVSIFLFGYLIGQPIFAIASQRYSLKKALMIGFTINTLSSFMQIVAIHNQLFNLLIIARFFCALGSSAGLVCVFSIINYTAKDSFHAQKLISLAFVSLLLSAYLSITIGSFIVTYLNWANVFYLLSGLSIVYIVLIGLFIPESIENSNKLSLYSLSKKVFSAFGNKDILITSLIVSLTTTSSYLYNTIGSTISSTFFHNDSGVFGFFSVVNLIALVLGSILSTLLRKKLSIINSLLVGICIYFISIIPLYVAHGVIFNVHNKGLFFFIDAAFINFSIGLIYSPASYLALKSIKCGSTASSVMNVFKIGAPAFIILLISNLNLDIITSYTLPITLVAIIASSCLVLKYYKIN